MTAPPRGSATTGAVVSAALTVTGLLLLWFAPPLSEGAAVTIWALFVGTGFAASGVVCVRNARGPGGWLFLAGAAPLLAAPIAHALGRHGTGDGLIALGCAGVLPLALLRVVERRRGAAVLRALDVTVVAAGVTCSIAVLVRSETALVAGGIVGVVAFGGSGWLQFELTSGRARRQVLWLLLGVVTSVVPSFLVFFQADGYPGLPVPVTVLTGLLSLILPLCAGIGLTAPDRFDVRALIGRTTVVGVMLALVVAVFAGAAAGWRLATGTDPPAGLLGLLAAAIAAGYHPAFVQARAGVEELLFGGRPDPLRELTQLGGRLTAGSSPQDWLDPLRAALGVPAVELRQDGDVLARSGDLAAVAGRHLTTSLRVGDEVVGELVVALAPDQPRLHPSAGAVVAVVVPPLAQGMHALRLSTQLQASRTRVLAALEEERRRVRRDLHDGLGSTLTGIAYSAEAASNLLPPGSDAAAAELVALRTDAADAIAEIRRIVDGLRPRALDELGLIGALRQGFSRMRAADGRVMSVQIHAPAELAQLPAAVEVVAYRVVMEAVTNVARHAGVASALVSMGVDDRDRLTVTIDDAGGSVAAWRPGVGLTSMRERVEQIGGAFDVRSDVERSRVQAVLPLHL